MLCPALPSRPRALVAFPCGSRSIKSPRFPFAARQVDRFTAVVVLPTPPFWFAIASSFIGSTVLVPQIHKQRRKWLRRRGGKKDLEFEWFDFLRQRGTLCLRGSVLGDLQGYAKGDRETTPLYPWHVIHSNYRTVSTRYRGLAGVEACQGPG